MAGQRKSKRKRKTNAGALSTQRIAEKREDVAAGWGTVDWLPRSLRSVAGAPQTARKKKPATPVGMTE